MGIIAETKSITTSIQALRKNLIEEKIVAEQKDGLLKFEKDAVFGSPSTAAIVLGMSANGRYLWKNEQGISLNELQAKELDENKSNPS